MMLSAKSTRVGQVPEFIEVADRVWVARCAWFDVNVTAIAGERGLAVVDTFVSAAGAREVLTALRRVSQAPLIAAVNTHVHFDHTFGNAVLAAEGAELIAHEAAIAALPEHAARTRTRAATEEDPRYAEVAATEIAVPERSFSSVLALDLGDRLVEVLHPGRGHTDGDAVVRVAAADVLLAGDLVEESAAPSYGEDCFPMDWPASLDVVLGLLTANTVVVPGHGAPVGRDFVEEQRAAIGIVAETIRDLATRGVPLDQALETATAWPYPREGLDHAVRRGYEQLPRQRRQLPLL